MTSHPDHIITCSECGVANPEPLCRDCYESNAPSVRLLAAILYPDGYPEV